MRRLLIISLLLLTPIPSLALLSEGRPGVPYFNHPLFLNKKIMEGDQVSWVNLAYGDNRQQQLTCNNTIDVFNGRDLFRNIPEKSWVLVDYELQSILIEGGFFGDADVSRVIPCPDAASCAELAADLNSKPSERQRQAKARRPTQTETVSLSSMDAQLETGRQLVKAARCRGCHRIEGFGAEHAPSLTWKRFKYEPNWLKTFLRAPYRMRPGMKNLMMLKYTSPNARPSLKGIEADAVAAYLTQAAWTRTPTDRFRNEPWVEYDCFDCHQRLYKEKPLVFVPTTVTRRLQERIDDSSTYRLCSSCHAFGDFRTPAVATKKDNPFVLAPDHLLSMEKLDIGYFIDFIRDPQYLQPDARMPKLGLSQEQLNELKDLVKEVKQAISTGELQPRHIHYEMLPSGGSL